MSVENGIDVGIMAEYYQDSERVPFDSQAKIVVHPLHALTNWGWGPTDDYTIQNDLFELYRLNRRHELN